MALWSQECGMQPTLENFTNIIFMYRSILVESCIMFFVFTFFGIVCEFFFNFYLTTIKKERAKDVSSASVPNTGLKNRIERKEGILE